MANVWQLTAKEAFERASQQTREDSSFALDLLATGFDITFFRETSPRLWIAVIKPRAEIASHFGLFLEYLVVGNGFDRDFHQRTLVQEPPENYDLRERIDSTVRFVVSDAAVAPSLCAAWAARKKVAIVLLKTRLGTATQDYLYQTLGAHLWRRDLFAETEPVRLPLEFYGRELVVQELLAKIVDGAPVAVFGLRKVGKSSLLSRAHDLLTADTTTITATAFVLANAARFKSGRWWDMAQEILVQWQASLEREARVCAPPVAVKAEKLSSLVSKRITDTAQLAAAFERDVLALHKIAQRISTIRGREGIRLVAFIDECDHTYPNLRDSGAWRDDFFVLWNTLQTTKRRLDNPAELVYVLGGVNPSGVEQGVLADRANPLFETQRIYLGPMSREDAAALLTGIGARMGLQFQKEAIDAAYSLVGGHPLLLRKLGSAIHAVEVKRARTTIVTASSLERAFRKNRREFHNQVLWILEHLAAIAPDEERLLRDIAVGGPQGYLEIWRDNEYRETFAHHLEMYGLVEFDDDVAKLALPLIRDAIQRPPISEFEEQKKQLKELVDEIEVAIRARLVSDLEKNRTPSEAVDSVVRAIPGDAKNRPLGRQELLDIGEVAGLVPVMDNLNWGDYEILMLKFYEEIQWVGVEIRREERMAQIKQLFKDAHLVRHNNNTELQSIIKKDGFAMVYKRFCDIREMFAA